MSKSKSEISENIENCEIIETAIEDLELLTRAFDLISEVCEEFEVNNIEFEGTPSYLH